ncbi:YciI family protein [Rugamonas sp.]|uniref:YciI family protein n=1 Tax=Rugamonas sp. TaxID=1926287 RepID=UPI0025F5C8D2|nr:YciI family protein [Rugamonas sp.]
MRFMIIVKATAESESGAMPSQQLLEDMGKFNAEMAEAGVLQAGEGLHPSARGARIAFRGDERHVIDGPFPDVRELVAGFWLIQVASRDEAIAWMRRCPRPFDGDCEIEIRQLFEIDDFGDAATPELREQEARLRAQTAKH